MTEIPKHCSDCRWYAVINAASGAAVFLHLKTPEEQKRSFCTERVRHQGEQKEGEARWPVS